jgi:predicted deacylase
MRSTLRLLVAGFLVALPSAASPERALLQVGEVQARPGEKRSGHVAVPDGADPGTRIPVTVVHGAKPGPVLALVAGTHGYEYSPILALQRLRARLDPANLSGSVILVHFANPTTFYGRRIYYSPDGKNLNRVFPGNSAGTISERIAHAITTEVIERATHVVDVHCGDGNESLRPYAYWQVTGDTAIDEAQKQMVLAFGLGHVVDERERPADRADHAHAHRGPAGNPRHGRVGRVGSIDEASVRRSRWVPLAHGHLRMLDAPSVRVEHPLWIDRAQVVTSPATGVWHPAVDQKDNVAAGALLGRLTDPFGDVIHEVRAPFAGEVLYVVATPPVSEGDRWLIGHWPRKAEAHGHSSRPARRAGEAGMKLDEMFRPRLTRWHRPST